MQYLKEIILKDKIISQLFETYFMNNRYPVVIHIYRRNLATRKVLKIYDTDETL